VHKVRQIHGSNLELCIKNFFFLFCFVSI
jgi:hypothetical protein